MITTDFDILFEVIRENKTMSLVTLRENLEGRGIQHKYLENYLKVFATVGIVGFDYSSFKGGEDKAIFINSHLESPLIIKTEDVKNGVCLDSYFIQLEYIKVEIKIFKIKGEFASLYVLHPMEVGEGTLWFIEYVSKQIPRMITVAELKGDTSSPDSDGLKKQISFGIDGMIKQLMPGASEEKNDVLSDIIMHESLGFGVVDFILKDNNLEEVMFQGVENPITVYHKRYGWMKTNIYVRREEHIRNIAEIIGRRVGKTIDIANPVLDAHTPAGERINAILFPVSDHGNAITIRKSAANPWTIIHLIHPKNGSLDKRTAALLWLCMQYELNILIAGGTASGKTTFLNAICQFLPANQHVITIEEVRELTLPKYFNWNWVPLVEKKGLSGSGKGTVLLVDLLTASLRMRPDRIIIGEVRRPKEAEVMFGAMQTGHSAYATFHADNSQQVYRRLVSPPFSIQPIDLESLDLVVVPRRDRRTGKRRVYEIAEVKIPETIKEQEKNPISIIYRWDNKKDELIPVNPPKKIFERIYFYTGMDEEEINKNLREKEKILQWMLDNNISTVDNVGKVVSMYYEDPKYILDFIRKGNDPKEILEN